MEPVRNGNPNKRSLTDQNSSSPEKRRKTALYLQDYTPIRTIEVTNLPDNVCSAYVHGYFENTGPVENVKIVQREENNKKVFIAYVTFVLPDDAGRLICDETNRCNYKFSVKAADSDHQPKIDPNVLNLEDVNDHCLLHIMSFLDLIDVVNLGKACPRLQSTVGMVYERKSHFSYGANTGDSSINELNLPIILKEIGGYIESIELHDLNAKTLDIVAEHCPNVTVMKFHSPSTYLSSQCFKKNKTFFEKLRRLHIKNAQFYDLSLKMMFSVPTLKTLNLENCQNIRGTFLPKNKSTKLKHLRIINCAQVNSSYDNDRNWGFFKNFQRNNKLFTFSSDKSSSYFDCLTSPPELLAKLKELELDFSRFVANQMDQLNFYGLTRLTKLTVTRKQSQYAGMSQDHHLAIPNIKRFENFNIVFTAMSQIKTLESLSIEDIEIDGNTVKSIGSIENLKVLHLKNIRNGIGKYLHKTLHLALPNLTDLCISEADNNPEGITAAAIPAASICNMIASLPRLRHFSHSSMTWLLLSMILKVQLPRAPLVLNIAISQTLFNDPKKKEFDVVAKGVITLTLKA